MTQNEKELLIKDLSGRLPYGVKINSKCGPATLIEIRIIDKKYAIVVETFNDKLEIFSEYNIDDCKPYLRSMDSMTEEEVKEFYDVECMDAKVGYIKPTWNWHFTINGIDWLNVHNFDYRGLIEKGLALEAPAGMYV